MRRVLPLALALAAALPVAAVAGSIESRYEATASVRVQTLFETGELTSLAGLSDAAGSAGSPLLQAHSPALDRVGVRTARRLRRSSPLEPDELRVIDTGAELIPAHFTNDPVRRLKVKALAESSDDAARLANAYLSEYRAERDRLIERLLSEARDRLSTGSAPNLRGLSAAGRGELVEAADIAIDLHGGVLTYDLRSATAPKDPISPRPLRDAIVAGLIGALAGWLLGRPQVVSKGRASGSSAP